MARDPEKLDRHLLYRRHLHRLCLEFREEVRRYWRRYIEVYRPPLEIHQTSDEWPERRPRPTLFQEVKDPEREVKDLEREIVTRWPEAPGDAFEVRGKILQRSEWAHIPLAWVLNRVPNVDPAPPLTEPRLDHPARQDLVRFMPELVPEWDRREMERAADVRARLAMSPPPPRSRNRKRNERLVIQWPGLPVDSVEARRLNALALAEADVHGLAKDPFTWPVIVGALWPHDWDLKRYREAERREYLHGERVLALDPLRKQIEKPLRKLLRDARRDRDNLSR